MCFPGSSPAKIRPGRPISGPEALLHNSPVYCIGGRYTEPRVYEAWPGLCWQDVPLRGAPTTRSLRVAAASLDDLGTALAGDPCSTARAPGFARETRGRTASVDPRQDRLVSGGVGLGEARSSFVRAPTRCVWSTRGGTIFLREGFLLDVFGPLVMHSPRWNEAVVLLKSTCTLEPRGVISFERASYSMCLVHS